MPLKVVRRHGSRFLYVRGTVRGQPVDETTGTENEAHAEAYRIKRENDLLERSLLGEKAPKSFVRACFDYIEAHELSKRDQAYVIRLAEHFQGKHLGHIDQQSIDAAVRRFCPKGSPATVNRTVIGPIAAILHYAGDARKIRRRKAPRGRTRWLTYAEAERLIQACKPHKNAPYKQSLGIQPLVTFLLFTGCRIGEAFALDWRNVDLKRRHAVFLDTKNGEDRGVPLNQRAVDALVSLPNRVGPVFLRGNGKPYKPKDEEGGQIKTALRLACKRAGIAPAISAHVCRHTWATWHYAENRNVRALMELGGWKTISQVQRYTHINREELRGGVERLANTVPGNSPG